MELIEGGGDKESVSINLHEKSSPAAIAISPVKAMEISMRIWSGTPAD